MNKISGKSTTVATIELVGNLFLPKNNSNGFVASSAISIWPIRVQISIFLANLLLLIYIIWHVIFENKICIFSRGKHLGFFWNYPVVSCQQHRHLLANMLKVMVPDIEQKHGISQTYLFTFDWHFLGDLSHRFKTLPQDNPPMLSENNTLVFAYFSNQVW